MKYPRWEPSADVRCGSHRCCAVAFYVPAGPECVIECAKRGCNRYVRADTEEVAERTWRRLIRDRVMA